MITYVVCTLDVLKTTMIKTFVCTGTYSFFVHFLGW